MTESPWGPGQSARKFDWSAPVQPAPPTSTPAPAGSDDLDDLFVPEAPAPAPAGAWDAPAPGAPAWAAGVVEEGGLDDLFEEDMPSLPSQASPAEAESGLDDLFSDAPEAPAQPESSPVEESGLDDLFSEPPAEAEPTAGVPAGEVPAGEAAPAEVPAVEVAPPAPVEASPVEAESASTAESGAPRSDWSGISVTPTAPEWSSPPASPAAVVSLTGLAGMTPKKNMDLGERRKEAEKASLTNHAAEQMRVAAAAEEMRRRYQQAVHLWPQADRILGLISSDPFIQSRVNGFALTQDRVLDSQQRRLLQEVVSPRMIDAGVNLNNPKDISTVFDMVYDELTGISVLGPLWRDEEVTEIMVDAWDSVVVERGGTLVPTPMQFRDLKHAQRVARDMAQVLSGRGLSPVNPLVTAQLPGARVTFAYEPVVKTGISISLRKFRSLMGMESLMKVGALTPEMREFLEAVVVARATILVSGGTGTGKTTMINALSQFIPDTERVVTIEDNFELQLSNKNVVAMQTKEKASADDDVIIGQAELFENTLRMRPDRVIVGEIREGEGAVVMLRSANTGHDGTMTTIHANSAQMAINERMVDLIREASSRPDDVAKRSVASGVDLVVQVTRRHKRRYISEISVVDRTCFVDGDVVPDPVFRGEIDPDGNITFRHVGGVRPDTALGLKMLDAGYDLTRWEL